MKVGDLVKYAHYEDLGLVGLVSVSYTHLTLPTKA